MSTERQISMVEAGKKVINLLGEMNPDNPAFSIEVVGNVMMSGLLAVYGEGAPDVLRGWTVLALTEMKNRIEKVSG